MVEGIEERKTYHPIYESTKPADRVAFYVNFRYKKKFPDASNPSVFEARVRAAYGGNQTDYTG